MWTPMYPKTTSVALRREKKRKEVKRESYSVEPEAKFTRERCIRVAAIISMIKLGTSNIYMCKRIRNLESPLSDNNKTYVAKCI